MLNWKVNFMPSFPTSSSVLASDTPAEIQFIRIPPGLFLMGGIEDDKFVTALETPAHEVVIRGFEISIHPVTRGQWCAAMGSQVTESNHPITSVSYHDAMEFAHLHGARLPTEAEWEYACRAGSQNLFPHKSHLTIRDANFLYDESGGKIGLGSTTPIGSYPANGFGLYDMIGNVCEWTTDWWHPSYHHAPGDGSAWIAGGQQGRRVIRGGAWDQLPRTLRASWRDWAPENANWDNLGFRLARDL